MPVNWLLRRGCEMDIITKLNLRKTDGLLKAVKKLLKGTGKTSAAISIDQYIWEIIKHCARFLIDTVDKLSLTEAEELTSVCETLIALQTSRTESFVRAIYHVIHHFLRLGHFAHATRVSVCLLRLADDLPKTKDVANVMTNLYLSFWNHASDMEAPNLDTNTHSKALLCRLEALKYLVISGCDLVKIVEQAQRAGHVFDKHSVSIPSGASDTSLAYFKSANELVLKAALPTEHSDSLAARLVTLHRWNLNYAAALEKAERQDLCLAVYDQLKVLQSIASHPECASVVSASKICLDLLRRVHAASTDSDFSEVTKTIEILKTSYGEGKTADATFQMVLATVKTVQAKTSARIQSDVQEMRTLAEISSVHSVCCFYIRLLKEEREQIGGTEVNYAPSTTVVSQLLKLFSEAIRISSDDKYMHTVLKQAEEWLGFLSNMTQEPSFEMSSLLPAQMYNIGATTGNIGAACYAKSWYTEGIIFLETACTYLENWCLQDPSGSEERFQSINLWNKYTLLVANLRKSCCYEVALTTLAKAISLFGSSPADFFEQWVRLKRDACINKCVKVNNWTVRNQVPVTKVTKELGMYNILHMELKAFKRQRYSTVQDCRFLITCMIKEANTPIQLATALTELAQVQWLQLIKDERSAVDCCETAIHVIENVLSPAKTQGMGLEKKCELRLQLASANFWLYLAQLQKTQNESDAEISKAEATIPWERQFNKPEGDEEEESANHIIHPHYHITVDREIESLLPLDRALDVWEDLIYNCYSLIGDSVQTLKDLKASAEIYSLAGQVVQELKSWKLVLELSKFSDCSTDYVFSAARLCQLLCRFGKPEEAEKFFLDAAVRREMLNGGTSEEILVSIKFNLAGAELFLYTKQFKKGADFLREAYQHPHLKRRTRPVYMIMAEVMFLIGQYCLIPLHLRHSIGPQPWDKRSAIEITTQSVQYAVTVAKILTGVNNIGDDKEICSPGISHYVVNFLSMVNLHLGKMYAEVGAPREARCYLKEQLLVCQRVALAHKSIEILLMMAKVDIMCDNGPECMSKMRGVAYMLQPNPVDKKNVRLKLPQLSRLFTALDLVLPPFCITHQVQCNCTKCKNGAVNHMALEMMLNLADHLAMQGKPAEAEQLFAFVIATCQKWFPRSATVKRDNAYSAASCTILQDEMALRFSTFLCSVEKYEKALQFVESSLEALRASERYHPNLPFLYSKLLWQKSLCMIHIAAKCKGVTPIEFLSGTNSVLSDTSVDDLADTLKDINIDQHSDFKIPKTPKFRSSRIHLSGSRSRSLRSSGDDSDSNMTPLKNKHIDRVVADTLFQDNCKAPPRKTRTRIVAKPGIRGIEPDEVFEDAATAGSRSVKTPRSALRKMHRIYSDESEELSTVEPTAFRKRVTRSKAKFVAELSADGKENLRSSSEGSVHRSIFELPDGFHRTRATSWQEDDGAEVEDVHEVTTVDGIGDGECTIDSLRLPPLPRRTSRNRAAGHGDAETVRLEDELPNPAASADVTLLECLPIEDEDEVEVFSVDLATLPPIEMLRAGRKNKPTVAATTSKLQEESKSSSAGFCEPADDDVEVLRQVESCAIEILTDLDKESQQEEENYPLPTVNWNVVTIESVTCTLEEAYSWICHHPPSPLYPDLCLMLAMAKGTKATEAAYYMSESPFVTLRHRAVATACKKLYHCQKDDYDGMEEADSVEDDKTKSWSTYLDVLQLGNAMQHDKSSLLKNHVDSILPGWVVCQIGVVPAAVDKPRKYYNRQLLLARYEHGVEPLVVKVPSAFDQEEEVPKTLLDSHHETLDESKKTMRYTNKVEWWESRRGLDARMKSMVADLEDVWLRCWKCLFVANSSSSEYNSELQSAAEQVVKVAPGVDLNLIKVILNSISWLSPLQLAHAVSYALGFEPESEKVQVLCKILNLKAKKLKGGEVDRLPVILVLDKAVECLPWENMPILRDHSVSRMPSLSLLHGHLARLHSQRDSVFVRGVDASNTYFILNPGNDLPNTQQTFEDLFVNQEKWNGIVGQIPNGEQFTSAICEHDMFVYCGHGSGTKYLSSDRIQRLDCKAATLLMGCSSGKLTVFGPNLEPGGPVLQYMIGGCPCVAGALWDVTDRDIDRFLLYLLQNWLHPEGGERIEITNVVPGTRTICRLPYLIGASVVVYGLPVHARVGLSS